MTEQCGNKGFELTKDETSGITTITLSSPPANTLSLELLTNLIEKFRNLEKDDSVKGVLVTSKYNGETFISGLNSYDMYKQTDERLAKYWAAVQDIHLTMYSFGKPVVAAINGDAVAGGCAFVLTCDYRVMMTDKRTGLPEAKFGIVAPFFYIDVMKAVIGNRQCELALLEGKIFSTEEAAKVGLVDEAVDINLVLPNAMEKLQQLVKIPQPAFKLTKQSLRQADIEKFIANRDQNLKVTVGLIQQPFAQAAFGNIIKQLEAQRQSK
ncbi:enoyl-CoA delta isomerase 1, mitochondrial-like [Ciona intestinalis]